MQIDRGKEALLPAESRGFPGSFWVPPSPHSSRLRLAGKIINLEDKKRDKDHLLKMVSPITCSGECIREFPKPGAQMHSSPASQLLPLLEVAGGSLYPLHSSSTCQEPCGGAGHPHPLPTLLKITFFERTWRGDSQTPSF